MPRLLCRETIKTMTDEEITALAREYAEDMTKGPEFEKLSDGLKKNVLELNTDYAAEIFRWLQAKGLIPYTKPNETFTDERKSQCKSQDFDAIIKNGFRHHLCVKNSGKSAARLLTPTFSL